MHKQFHKLHYESLRTTMDHTHFNAFYKAFNQSLKIKNIYINQFKYCSYKIIIFYIISVIALIVAFGFLTSANSIKNQFITGVLFLLMSYIFFYIDKMTLKMAVKEFQNKYNIKLIFPSLFDQYKYYLWKDKLNEQGLSFSIDKALNYINIELIKFEIKNNKFRPIEVMLLSSVTIFALWRLVDDMHLSYQSKIIIDGLVGYASYRYITFKTLFFEDKHEKLLMLRQFLLRLKAEK